MTVVLSLAGVSRRFGGLAAVSDVSFDVAEGELIGLVGPNGAGKSTLFNMIAGVFPPTAGTIALRGHDITGRASHDLARLGIARTFQLVTLFGEQSALDNVVQGLHRHGTPSWFGELLGLPGARAARRAMEARAREVLDLLGIGAQARERAADLPLGTQKLLAVAIALATRPTLLLLDEPAAGLSHDEARRMMDLVSTTVRKQCTVLLVEHNMRIVSRYCDRAIVLQFGRTIYDGDPAGLVRDQRVVDAYLGAEEFS